MYVQVPPSPALALAILCCNSMFVSKVSSVRPFSRALLKTTLLKSSASMVLLTVTVATSSAV